MPPLTTPPGFMSNLFSLGIARARWTANANRAFGHRSGFWFAWLLQPFANYGIVRRLNDALAELGSEHRESPVASFLLTGWPLVGASRRIKRGVSRLNDVIRISERIPVPSR